MATTREVLRPAARKVLGLLLGCLVFVAGGVWMWLSGEAVGWILAGFFGLGVIACLVILIPNSSYLALTNEGFVLRRMYRDQAFNWVDVGPFRVGTVGGKRMVVFDFDGRYSAQARVRVVSRFLSGSEGALPPIFGLSLGELAAKMNAAREEALGAG